MVVVTLGRQYNSGEKLTVVLYTYIINRHAGTPEKQPNKNIVCIVITYYYKRLAVVV